MTALAIGGTVLAIVYIAVKALDMQVPVDVADDVDWESNEGWGGRS